MYSKKDMEVSTKIVEIKLGDRLYPKMLSEINDPPKSLFCRGNLELLNQPMTAVIGTRKPSEYGIQIAEKVSKHIAEGEIVVSGLAYGIDSIAHLACVENDGRTVAVLGSGVDDHSIYPQSHVGLANRIIASGGLVISEYVAGSKPLKFHFPARNRIIAGLASQVIVIEAGLESGTTITANLALDYNREVWAVPGNIDSPQSQGTNRLISEGAKPLVDIRQIVIKERVGE